MEIITRSDALRDNLKYYFTGIPCRKGHLSKRRVHNSTCYECNCLARNKADTPLKVKTRNAKRYILKKKEIDENSKAWRENNKGQYNALLAKYRAKKLKATPTWADLKAITEFYKNCLEGKVVDHIIPLQGKFISGFHVVENLQYLTPRENSVKSNLFTPRLI